MEIWKDIKNWPFHQISNRGRVLVLPGATVAGRCIVKMELRKLTRRPDGYIIVRQGYNSLYVHSLVLTAFVGAPRPGYEARHLNGDPSDNRLKNLMWGTREENYQNQVRRGTYAHGERHGSVKLTESEVIAIKNRPHDSSRALAKEYNVSHQAISSIRTGRTWQHVLIR
jgi:hypothetical protein